jgi:RNase adaptor protein for sRNA GlmZ degradation
MKQEVIDFIDKNDELNKFINKIYAFYCVFENECLRNMHLASLISADCLTDKKRCCYVLDELDFLTRYLNMITLDIEVKRKTAAFIVDANKITKKELRRFEREEKKNAPQK